MNIAILSREPNNYSTRRLVEVAQARGHQVEVLDTLHPLRRTGAGEL